MWPSSDLYFCPQSAEYDCSPQAKEPMTALNTFSLFKHFPGEPEIGQKNGWRMPHSQPTFSWTLSPDFFFLFFIYSSSHQSRSRPWEGNVCIKSFSEKDGLCRNIHLYFKTDFLVSKNFQNSLLNDLKVSRYQLHPREEQTPENFTKTSGCPRFSPRLQRDS